MLQNFISSLSKLLTSTLDKIGEVQCEKDIPEMKIERDRLIRKMDHIMQDIGELSASVSESDSNNKVSQWTDEQITQIRSLKARNK